MKPTGTRIEAPNPPNPDTSTNVDDVRYMNALETALKACNAQFSK